MCSAGRLAGIVLLFLQLTACSHTLQTTRLQQSPPAALPSSHELAATPFFPQRRYQCGPAALATVLGAQGVRVHPDGLVDKVYLPARQGSVPLEMEAAARSYGMLVYPLEPRLEALLAEVAAGYPVLVLQNLRFSWWPRWHYAVVVGYDLERSQVVLRSGETRRYRVAMGVFEKTWRRAEHWARVILPPEGMPASAKPLTYLRAALALEQSRQVDAALSSYRTASRQWPESALAWLAHGNLAYRLGDYASAESSFRDGVAHLPQQADLWNNLGYALAGQGCAEEALAAVRCALVLQPDSTAYGESLDELKGAGGQHGRCEPVTCPF